MAKYLPYVIIVVVFVAATYFFSIRPHNKAALDQYRKNKGLKPGDRIITIGGFYAVIEEKGEYEYIIALEPDGVRMRISPDAISVYPEDIQRSIDARKEMNEKMDKYTQDTGKDKR